MLAKPPDIKTVVQDIYSVLMDKTHEYSPANIKAFADAIAATIAEKLEKDQKPRLRFSNIGETCDRRLWLSIHCPDLGRALPPYVRMKFLYGDIMEELVVFLAAEAGHRVEGRQTPTELHGINGSLDLVLDGMVTDVKSASTKGFEKFATHLTKERKVRNKDGSITIVNDDQFGYLDQVGAYHEASQDNPAVTDKTRFAFLAVDKTLGHIVLDVHEKHKDNAGYFKKLLADKKKVLAGPEPAKGFLPVAEGKSGNMKLGVKCSYCEFQEHCYPEARIFLYSKGPVYLTTVARLPDVPELGAATVITEEPMGDIEW